MPITTFYSSKDNANTEEMPAPMIYLIEVLQHGFIISCPAEGSSFELNGIYILLLRLLQLNASMQTVGGLCERTTEACGALQQYVPEVRSPLQPCEQCAQPKNCLCCSKNTET